MELSYQKPAKDHPMYGKIDFIVTDGKQELCYKTSVGYSPCVNGNTESKPVVMAEIKTNKLYVLSFKINGETEQMTFSSKSKLDKVKAVLESKVYVLDIKLTEYSVLI